MALLFHGLDFLVDLGRLVGHRLRLVAGIVVRDETPEYVAEDYDLPVEAVREALDYYYATEPCVEV